MSVYFVDNINGNNNNDGLSELTPVIDEASLNIVAGDTVLFKRGNFYRRKLESISGESGKPITYGAYGEGEKPIFCGSVSLDSREDWYQEEKNIWVCDKIDNDEAGNIVYNNSESFGTLRWTKSELSEQGDFFDNCFGYREQKLKITGHKVYIYSEKNPADYYNSIECVVYGKRNLANNGKNINFENLKFQNSGVHALSGEGESRNINVANCDFENIGGCVWNAELKIRYGNGIEFWNVAENITVHNCRFCNIYDSAVTHQGGKDCDTAKQFIIEDNLFVKCGMAAYEQRDRMTVNSRFNNNICVDAGEGFSKQGEIMPRRSEIWPQPMGHHVFLWRIKEPSENGGLEIKNNIFCNAPYGAAIYSIISEDAENQINIEGNTYFTKNTSLLNRLHGKNYALYSEYTEKNSKYEVLDGKNLIENISY